MSDDRVTVLARYAIAESARLLLAAEPDLDRRRRLAELAQIDGRDAHRTDRSGSMLIS